MEFNLDESGVPESIKRIAAFRGYTLTKLGSEFNRRYGTNYNQQSFSRKLRSGAITCGELKKFGDLLGFTVNLELK